MTILNKKAVSQGGNNSLDPKIAKGYSDLSNQDIAFNSGIAGDPILDPYPQYLSFSDDVVYKNEHNSFIVLGRDRPRSLLSGYGGRGDTQAGAIDIVVGRMAYEAKSHTSTGSKIFANPDFKKDSARIYISQKTDIDENFGLAAGTIGISRTRSGIALKADGVRIIGREGIKLITNTEDKNSQGGPIEAISGIDIIAGNNDQELQPMVKGQNLVDALEGLVLQIDKLNGIVDGLLTIQTAFNAALTSHFHFSPFFGLPTSPSPTVAASGIVTLTNHLSQVKMSLLANKANLIFYKYKFLNPTGVGYINSRYNNVN